MSFTFFMKKESEMTLHEWLAKNALKWDLIPALGEAAETARKDIFIFGVLSLDGSKVNIINSMQDWLLNIENYRNWYLLDSKGTAENPEIEIIELPKSVTPTYHNVYTMEYTK